MEIAERVLVVEHEIRVHLEIAHRLLAVPPLGVPDRILRFALRAKIVVEIHAAAQHERQLFAPDIDVHRDVAVHAVAILRVELLVNHEIGIVAAGVDQIARSGRSCGIHGRDTPFAPLGVHIVDAHRRRIPDQRIERRSRAVTGRRKIVAVLAIVVGLTAHGNGLGNAGREGEAEILALVTRIGDDPVVAHVLERHAGRIALAVAALDGDRIGIGDARTEESFVPILRHPRFARILVGIPVAGRVDVAHLRGIVALAERRTGVIAGDLLPRVALVGRHVPVGVFGRRGHAVDLRRLIDARSVLLLEIGPETGLFERDIRIECHAQPSGFESRLGGDDDRTVGCARPVERRGCGALQDRYRLDIVGIEIRSAVAVIDRTDGAAVGAVLGIGGHAAVDRHAVDNEQRFVLVISQRPLAAQRHANRSAGTGRRSVEIQTRHLPGHPVEPVVRDGVVEVFGADRRNGVAQTFFLARQSERRHHHGVDLLRFGEHLHIEAGARTDHPLQRFITQIGKLQRVGRRGDADRVTSLQIGDGMVSERPLHHHRHADQRHGGLTAFTTDNGAFDHPGLSLCGFPGNYGEQQSQGQES